MEGALAGAGFFWILSSGVLDSPGIGCVWIYSTPLPFSLINPCFAFLSFVTFIKNVTILRLNKKIRFRH